MAFVLAFVFAPVLAAEGMALDLAARAEARGSTPAPGAAPAVSSGQSQIDATATLTAASGELQLAASYQPRLVVLVPGPNGVDTVANFLSNGRLAADYHFSSLQTLRLEEQGSYGRQDFSPLVAALQGGPPPVTPVNPRLPITRLLAIFNSTTSATYQQKLSPTTEAGSHLGFQIGGGADDLARRYLPIGKTVQGDARLGWKADRHDDLSVTVAASDAVFGNVINADGSSSAAGSNSQLFTGALGWKRALGRETTMSLSAGGGASRTVGPSGGRSWQSSLLSSAALSTALNVADQRLGAGLGASVSSVVDPLGNGVYELAEGHLTLGYEPTRSLRAALNFSTARSLGGGALGGQQVSVLDASIGYAAAANVSLTGGVRGALQTASSATQTPGGTQFAAYFAVSVTGKGRLP